MQVYLAAILNEADISGTDLMDAMITEREISGTIMHASISHKWVTWAGSY